MSSPMYPRLGRRQLNSSPPLLVKKGHSTEVQLTSGLSTLPKIRSMSPGSLPASFACCSAWFILMRTFVSNSAGLTFASGGRSFTAPQVGTSYFSRQSSGRSLYMSSAVHVQSAYLSSHSLSGGN